ncbi:protein of unknown function [Pseudomonas inefficax]|uniref:Uncharacterized protein n=1 Tax=Pseudomonas inefficax TaxID=2078786 RepID=A0AAQ1P401_9PSED|nr:protein of unknown function [Pseudomonas inefficax]
MAACAGLFAAKAAPTGFDTGYEASAILVGAGLPAITGAAGAMHRVACFAGLPAPTITALASRSRSTCGSGRAREEARTGC